MPPHTHTHPWVSAPPVLWGGGWSRGPWDPPAGSAHTHPPAEHRAWRPQQRRPAHTGKSWLQKGAILIVQSPSLAKRPASTCYQHGHASLVHWWPPHGLVNCGFPPALQPPRATPAPGSDSQNLLGTGCPCVCRAAPCPRDTGEGWAGPIAHRCSQGTWMGRAGGQGK